MKCPKCNFRNHSDSGFCSKCGTQLLPSKEIPISQMETLQAPKKESIPTTDGVLPKKKPTTTREITVQFKLKKLLIPVFVVIAIAIVGIILFERWNKAGFA